MRRGAAAGGAASGAAAGPYARVAVPVPLPGPLTYEVPEHLATEARSGVRVRVGVGRRRLVGVVLDRTSERPADVDLRPVEEVLDLEPVVPSDLLDLADFIADYYLAPIGEVVRSMLPSHLPPWGDRRVWLTSAGAIGPPRDEEEAEVLAELGGGERLSLAELHRRLALRMPLAAVASAVDRLCQDGRLASGERRVARGARYVSAVELPPGDVAVQLEGCGRSAPGREVVELLSALGRPATIAELTERVGCKSAVVRRLVSRGVLRRFTQVERLDLDRYRLSASEAPPVVLREDQDRARGALSEALSGGDFRAFLLVGVTGSGKTEVYVRAVEEALALGRSAILMVPEIALVPALARALQERFADRLAILHSGLGSAERHQEWERLRRGEARVVLGPRSAIFAPVADLGLVVVDEEQDPSYKQDTTPRYHGRDVALVRCRQARAVAVLVSATPSLESRWNAERGKLATLTLIERTGRGGLPEGVLVDLRREGPPRRPGEVFFSQRLRDELQAVFEAGDQAILLRNRRGYSPLLLCRACGEDLRCDECGLPRTYHRREGRLLCHYCGGARPAPARCPACGEAALEAIGSGTERVEETFSELFPGVAVGVLDRDSSRRPGGIAAVLERFGRGETRALIGTQMVSKGHHFPRVSLAAMLAADTYLGFPDFRAVERTYNLLVQLAGRAGRGDRPGKVVIQSYHPEHYAIRAALAHDDAAFAEEELRFRRVFHYPPYTRMLQLLVRDRRRERAEEAMAEIARTVAGHPLGRQIRAAGPAPAPFERLQGKWRFQLLLRAASGHLLRELARAVLPKRPAVEVVVDVDPHQLL